MFGKRLGAIASRLEGLAYASLVADDGIRVESYSVTGDLHGLDTDNLAVELLTQLRAVSQNHAELGLGAVLEYALSTELYCVMLGRVAPGYFLMFVLEKGASVGRARFELRRAPLAFEEDLL